MRLPLLLSTILAVWIASSAPAASAQSALPAGVDLRAGINSVGYLGPTMPVADALGAAAGAVTQIWRYDRFAAPGASPWTSWSPALPEALQGFRALTFGEAYFVVTDAAVRWDFPGGAPAPPATVRLSAGGNHIVYFGSTQPVEAAIGLDVAELRVAQLIDTEIEVIQRLDANGWSAWSPQLPPLLRGFDTLETGEAYFVTTTVAGEWNFGLPSPDDAIRRLLGDVLDPTDLDALIASAQPARTRQVSRPGVEPQPAEFPSLYSITVPGFASSPADLDIQTDLEYQIFLGVADRPLESDPLTPFATFTTGVRDPNGRLFDPEQPANSRVDPFTGISHSVNVFTDTLDGWQLAQSTDPLNGGPRETGAFGYAAAGEPFVFFAVPTDELPPIPLPNIGVGRGDAGLATFDSFFDVFVDVSVAARFPDFPEAGDFFNLTPAQPSEGPQDNHSCQMVHSTTFGVLYDLVCGAGRFLVEAQWTAPDGDTGRAMIDTTTAGLGVLRFPSGPLGLSSTDPSLEALVRVVDGCGFNGHFWVFAASTTSVEYTLTVTDTLSGEAQEFFSPLTGVADPIQDTRAFATCP